MSSDAEATTADGISAPPVCDVEELTRGTTLGRYVVLVRLGAGGMGVVYVCYDPNLDRKVALKLLYTANDPRRSAVARERLVHEAQALAKLTHPNVVAVHDVDEVHGRIYLAMEFVEGETLGVWTRAATRTWSEVLDVYVQAARGLAAAHEVGLVHRDFKPDNAMLGADGRVRVMDFGLARAAEPDATDMGTSDAGSTSHGAVRHRGLTATGAVLGTPAYMAPEQHRGLRADAKADQFSWCVALHEALFDARPFHADSVLGLALAVTEGRRSDIADERGVPRWLRRVIERGLAVDPQARFASMRDLLRALEAGRARAMRGRRLGVFAAVGAVAVGALGVREIGRQRAFTACAQAGDRIAEVWNDDTRESTRQSLLATGVSHAQESFERTTPWIDAAASAWRSTREQVCRSAEIERTLAPDLHERALACLDERKLEMQVLLESVAEADKSTVNRVVVMAATLDPVESCGDPSDLARQELPDPALRAEVRDIRRELTRARALYGAGRLEPAREAVEAALERARVTEWDAVIVHAALDRGTIVEALGQYEDAAESLREAFELGWAAGFDQEVTEAAQQLASLHANDLGKLDEAMRWGKLAQLTCARLGDQATAHAAGVHNAMSIVHTMRGEQAEALVESEAALANIEEAVGVEHPEVASVLTNIGAIHDRLGQHDQARAALERALKIREGTLGSHHPDVAAVLNNLAGVYLSVDDLELAATTWARALEISESSLGPKHMQVSLVLRNMSILHSLKGDLEEASRVAERALAIRHEALGPDHPLTADTAIGAGWLRSELGDHASALELLAHAVEAQETALGPDRPELALGLDRLGRVHQRLGDTKAALPPLARAAEILETKTPDDPDLGGVLSRLGALETELGDLAAAREHLRRAEARLCAREVTAGCAEARSRLAATEARGHE